MDDFLELGDNGKNQELEFDTKLDKVSIKNKFQQLN